MSVEPCAEPIWKRVGRIPYCNGYLFQGHEEGKASRVRTCVRDELGEVEYRSV